MGRVGGQRQSRPGQQDRHECRRNRGDPEWARRDLHQRCAEQHDWWYGGWCGQPDLRQWVRRHPAFRHAHPGKRDPGQRIGPECRWASDPPEPGWRNLREYESSRQPARWNGSWPGQSGSGSSRFRPGQTRRSGVDVLSGRQALRAAGERPPRCEPELSLCRILPAPPSTPLATGPHRGGRSHPRTGCDPGKSRHDIPGADRSQDEVEPVLLAGTHRPMTGGVKGMFRPGRPPKGTLSMSANSPLNGVGPVTG